MSFLNFGKDKLDTGHFDAAEIKQAAISDTQLNSLNFSNNNLNSNVQENVSNLTPPKSSSQNFVNPFSKTEEVSNNESVSNQSFEIKSLNSPLENSYSQPLNESPVPINQFSQPEKSNNFNPNHDLNRLNQNLTQSLQSQEALTKDQIKELIDETVEKVIEEKWDALTEKVDRVLRWKEKKEEEINMLKEDIVNIADGFAKLENKLVNRISSYDKNILDVNSEIKALEKVFQKVTPTLINNVNELSKIADDLRGVKKDMDKSNKKEE